MDSLFDWNDEQTIRLNFDKPVLTPDDKLIVGYLMMEEHDLFARLPIEEQLDVARRLRR